MMIMLSDVWWLKKVRMKTIVRVHFVVVQLRFEEPISKISRLFMA